MKKRDYLIIENITIREYIAASNLQGLLSKYSLNTPEDQITVTKMAVELTDQLLYELNNNK